MSLLECYEAAIKRGEIEADPLQIAVLDHLQRLADELKKEDSLWCFWRKKACIKGLYLYGPVGAGKTYLVDLFYQQVEEKKKARFHFHHFMQQVDVQLRRLQGKKDPLKHIAKEIAQSTRLLCFDEFLVHDVVYAMILAELLQALHAQEVVLVISSNTKPEDLYLKGVHRERFLPVIALLRNQSDVLYLNEKRDYRMGKSACAQAYLYPLNELTAKTMEQQFLLLAKEQPEKKGWLPIQNRDIPYIQRADKVLWFAFDVLCNIPRSALDYLELASQLDYLLLSGIPQLTENHTAQTILFIHLIDVMYDRGIHVLLSAAVPLDQLYTQGEMKETFQRTLSRLTEMQSVDYQKDHAYRILQSLVEE